MHTYSAISFKTFSLKFYKFLHRCTSAILCTCHAFTTTSLCKAIKHRHTLKTYAL